MTSVTTLGDLVDVVIGVDTHVESHSACAVRADNGAVIDRITVPTTRAGYRTLVEFADAVCLEVAGSEAGPVVAAMRAWAIEGTGGHGAGLTRVLDQRACQMVCVRGVADETGVTSSGHAGEEYRNDCSELRFLLD
jgi:hypothetical protein